MYLLSLCAIEGKHNQTIHEILMWVESLSTITVPTIATK